MSSHESPLQQYRLRRVLITGGTGFIGPWVAKRLSDCGARVWMCARDLGALGNVCDIFGIRAELARVNLAEPGAFREIFQAVAPDVTFNLAGYGVDPAERDEKHAQAINTSLVEEIASVIADSEATNWQGMRFVHAGSGAEYGSVDGPLTEQSATRPVSQYGRTKLAGTEALTAACSRKGLRALTARLFLVYGPGEHPSRLLPSLVAAAHSGQTLEMTEGEQLRDFTFVNEAAEGMLRLGCVSGAVPPVINVATGVQTSVRQFVECAANLLSMRPSQLAFGALPYRGDEVHQGVVDTALLEELTGWKPRASVAEGLQQTLEFESLRNRDKL